MPFKICAYKRTCYLSVLCPCHGFKSIIMPQMCEYACQGTFNDLYRLNRTYIYCFHVLNPVHEMEE